MRTATLMLCLIAAPASNACTWAQGYFHQVTALKGQVVGKDLRPFNWRWLRQMYVQRGARLQLYEYQPQVKYSSLRVIAQQSTDNDGRFDFGAVQPGHYILHIEARSLDEAFDVEVVTSRPQTKNVLIDISPVDPDCSGGHEFVVEES